MCPHYHLKCLILSSMPFINQEVTKSCEHTSRLTNTHLPSVQSSALYLDIFLGGEKKRIHAIFWGSFGIQRGCKNLEPIASGLMPYPVLAHCTGNEHKDANMHTHHLTVFEMRLHMYYIVLPLACVVVYGGKSHRDEA